MKKRFGLVLVALPMVLAGCGGSGEAPFDGIVIKFEHTFGDKIEAGLKPMIKKFVQLVKENEGVNVKVDLSYYGSYNDTRRVIGTELTSGTGPSMCIAYPDSVAYLMKLEAYDGQFVRRVDQYFNDEELGFGQEAYLGDGEYSDFISSYIEEGSQFTKTGTYVMPLMKSTEIMLYNKYVVGELMKIYRPALSGDAVWEFVDNMSFTDLMALAQLTVDHKTDLGLGNLVKPVFYDSDSNLFITTLLQKGLDYSHKDANGNVFLGLDKTVDAENYASVISELEQYRSWAQAGLIGTKKSENTYGSNYFKDQKVIFTIGSSGGAGYSFPQTEGMDFGVCRVPYHGSESVTPEYVSQGPSVVFLNDKGYSQAKNDEIFKYSWKLYKYLTNEYNNAVLCINNSEGYVPVRNSCYESELWGEYVDPVTADNYGKSAIVVRNKIGGHFLSTLVFNGSASYRDYVGDMVGKVIKGNESISTLVDTVVNNTKNDMSN